MALVFLGSCEKYYDDPSLREYTPFGMDGNFWAALRDSIDKHKDTIPDPTPDPKPDPEGLVARLNSSYTGALVVTVNGESTPAMTQTVGIEKVDGTHFNFRLDNFILDDGSGNPMGVGNIFVENIEVKAVGTEVVSFTVNRPITISDGTIESPSGMWLGPLLGDVPVKLQGLGSNKEMNLTIDIDMQATLGQTIHVTFASGAGDNLVDRLVASYTGDLVVSINGESSPAMSQTVGIEKVDASHFNFRLNNFILDDGSGNPMGVGTIFVENIAVTADGSDAVHFTIDRNITISEGTIESPSGMWLGPLLGEVPVKLDGTGSRSSMDLTIDIDMQATLGQTIHVTFKK